MQKYLKLLLQIILYPTYVIIVLIPYIVQYIIYLIYKNKIKVTLKNCVFIVNPSSGKKLGRPILNILKEVTKSHVINILKEKDYLDQIKKRALNLKKGEFLYLVIAGGDGTVNSLVEELNNFDKIDQVVFVPLPVGTGNDMSRSLGFGYNLNLHYIHQFFQRLNSKKCEVVKMDTWYFKAKRKNEENFFMKKKFILYFGMGCDAKVVNYYSKLRKNFPFLIQVTKINKLYFFFCWIILIIKELYNGREYNKLKNIETTIKDKKIDISKYGCVVVLSATVRQGFTNQWNKNLPENFEKQKIDDGIFELLSFDDYLHIGLTTSFVREINRLDRGSELKMEVGDRWICIQLDGEPFDLKGPFVINVEKAKQINVLKYIN